MESSSQRSVGTLPPDLRPVGPSSTPPPSPGSSRLARPRPSSLVPGRAAPGPTSPLCCSWRRRPGSAATGELVQLHAMAKQDGLRISSVRAFVIVLTPVTLEGYGVRLEPLAPSHQAGLAAAAADGRLWELWYTSVPEPDEAAAYIADALEGQRAGHMLPWVVRELASGAIVGSTRYHDIVAGGGSGRDRLHLVRGAVAAQPPQHRVQAAPPRPCVRDGGVQGRRVADGQLQLPSQRAIAALGRQARTA